MLQFSTHSIGTPQATIKPNPAMLAPRFAFNAAVRREHLNAELNPRDLQSLWVNPDALTPLRGQFVNGRSID